MHLLQLLVEAPLTAEYLYTAVAAEGLFETRLLTHYSGCWGPLQKQSTYTLHLLLGSFESGVLANYSCCLEPLWKQSAYLCSASEYIIWVDNKFSQKMRKLCTGKTSREDLKGGPRQVPRSLPLKQTIVYTIDCTNKDFCLFYLNDSSAQMRSEHTIVINHISSRLD